MAAYFFKCKEHGEFGKILPREVKTQPCPTCGTKSKRRPRPTTVSSQETLDNGLQARRVERIQGATELYRERARADKTKREVIIVSGKVEAREA